MNEDISGLKIKRDQFYKAVISLQAEHCSLAQKVEGLKAEIAELEIKRSKVVILPEQKTVEVLQKKIAELEREYSDLLKKKNRL